MKIKKGFKIEIIAVGSELLTPYFQDTNSLFLTARLNDLGMEVSYKTIVGDDWDDLVLCIKKALSRASLVIAIGGLGPTTDDRTKEALAAVLGRKLVFKGKLLRKIEERFRRRGIAMPAVNKKQAYIIAGAEILENKNGTAPGLWLDTGSNVAVLLPGPPQELKPMFEASVWPRLKKFKTHHTSRRVLKTAGLTESKVETLISDLYPQDPNLKVTTLAWPGQIEIHLTSTSRISKADAEKKLGRLEKKILGRLKENVFSTSGEPLEEVVGKLLRGKKKTLAAAESCTGGFLGHRLTNVPGSSDYFLLSVVAYSNESKAKFLGVPAVLIEKHGAVSPEVCRAMAEGVRAKAHSSFGLAITGIAGPKGGTARKPVGLVYSALSWNRGIDISESLFLGNREAIKFQSSQKALNMLRRRLLRKNKRTRSLK